MVKNVVEKVGWTHSVDKLCENLLDRLGWKIYKKIGWKNGVDNVGEKWGGGEKDFFKIIYWIGNVKDGFNVNTLRFFTVWYNY